MILARTRSVAVLGGGIAAAAAAAAFRRALPSTQVTLFAAEGAEPEYAGAAAPYLHEFHRLIGLQPELFRRRTGAVVVQEAQIHRASQAIRMASLSEMPHVEGAALHQLWLRWTAGDPVAPASWATVAQRARRRDDLADGLGVRFDAHAYLALLRDLAAHLGAKLVPEAADRTKLSEEHDLVIDTLPHHGGDWLRIQEVPGDLRWRERAQLEPDAAGETIDVTTSRVTWINGVWRAEANVAEADCAGRFPAPWTDNALAIGRAALRCETFDGQPLAVALAGIARALELLPRPGGSGREAEEYNRRTNRVHDYLLDWSAERWGATDIPPGLAAVRGQFAQRGRIPFRDEDPVPAGQWIGWLLGSGKRPRHIDLTALRLPENRLADLFAGF